MNDVISLCSSSILFDDKIERNLIAEDSAPALKSLEGNT